MLEAKARRGRPKGSGIDDTTRLETIARLLAENPSLKPTTAIKSIGITDPSVIRRLRDKFNEFSSGQPPIMPTAPSTESTAIANALISNSSEVSLRHLETKPERVKHVLAAGPSAARKVERRQRPAQRGPLQVVAERTPEPATAADRAMAAIASAVEAAQRADSGRASVRETRPTQASPAASKPIAAAESVSPPADPAAWLFMWSGLGVRLVSTAVEAQLALGAFLFRTPPLAAVVRNQLALNEMAMTMLGPLGSKAK